MLKLVKDWCEKFSVGSVLIAAYQSGNNEFWPVAFGLGFATFAISFYLAKRGVK
jgi:hypothetical protein